MDSYSLLLGLVSGYAATYVINAICNLYQTVIIGTKNHIASLTSDINRQMLEMDNKLHVIDNKLLHCLSAVTYNIGGGAIYRTDIGAYGTVSILSNKLEEAYNQDIERFRNLLNSVANRPIEQIIESDETKDSNDFIAHVTAVRMRPMTI